MRYLHYRGRDDEADPLSDVFSETEFRTGSATPRFGF